MLYESFFLGASLSLGCTLTCFPVIAVSLAASKYTSRVKLASWILLFLAGRFTAYSAIAAVTVSFYERFSGIFAPEQLFHLKAGTNIIFGFFLAMQGFYYILNKPSLCKTVCSNRFLPLPFVFGIAIGSAPCIPVIASVSKIFLDYSGISALLNFSLFFAGNALTFPLFFLFTFLKKSSLFQKISQTAQMTLIIVGCYYFIIAGILRFFGGSV